VLTFKEVDHICRGKDDLVAQLAHALPLV